MPADTAGEELVTVVVPAHNEERFLGDCLDSVLTQDYKSLQVLVVNGDSTDRTAEVVQSRMAHDNRVELLHNPRRNISSSLNMALRHARGRWLVRIDAHSTVEPSYVSLAIARLLEGWSGVGGRKDGVGSTSAGRAIAVAMGSRFGVGNSKYHYATLPQEVDHLPFGAYPVDVARRMNGWDERLVANEDFEFDHRLRQAGMRLLFEPRMVIHWRCRQSILDLYRQYHRYGAGKVGVTWLHPRALRLRHIGPPVLVAYSVVGLLWNARRPVRALAVVTPYALALLAGSLQAARRLDSSADRVRLPAAFLAMHVGWGVGFWQELVRRSLTPAVRAVSGHRG